MAQGAQEGGPYPAVPQLACYGQCLFCKLDSLVGIAKEIVRVREIAEYDALTSTISSLTSKFQALLVVLYGFSLVTKV